MSYSSVKPPWKNLTRIRLSDWQSSRRCKLWSLYAARNAITCRVMALEMVMVRCHSVMLTIQVTARRQSAVVAKWSSYVRNEAHLLTWPFSKALSSVTSALPSKSGRWHRQWRVHKALKTRRLSWRGSSGATIVQLWITMMSTPNSLAASCVRRCKTGKLWVCRRTPCSSQQAPVVTKVVIADRPSARWTSLESSHQQTCSMKEEIRHFCYLIKTWKVSWIARLAVQ